MRVHLSRQGQGVYMSVIYQCAPKNKLRFDFSRTLIFPVKDYSLTRHFWAKSTNQNYAKHDEK